MIIGISGKKGSGKDTVAEYCIDHLPEHVCGDRLAMADSLKEFYFDYCLNAGTSYSQLNCQEFKKQKHACGKTHRQMLQEIGCAMREIWPDFWIYRWEKLYDDIISASSICFVPDVRFLNEVKKIQDMGGKVLRLTRNVHDDQHESETALDDFGLVYVNNQQVGYQRKCLRNPDAYDAVLDNSDMGIEEQSKEAWKIVKGWIQ